jgi:Raf kinase inhibitor-like YbhB/YbcL family protein
MLETLMALALTSSAFAHDGAIPATYTCQGKDISVPLAWSGVPAGTRSLVLIVDDPDAPDPAAPKMTWVHWVVYNIPPGATGLGEAVKSSELPKGTLEGRNDWGRTGYGGPCPPVGRHRYFFKLYALDVVLPDLGTPDKARLERAMKGHVLEKHELVGTYAKR